MTDKVEEFPKWVHSKDKDDRGRPKESILTNNAEEEKAANAKLGSAPKIVAPVKPIEPPKP